MRRADTGSVPVTGLRFSKFFRSPIDNCFCKLALKRSDSATQLSLERKNFGSRTRLQETDPGQLFFIYSRFILLTSAVISQTLIDTLKLKLINHYDSSSLELPVGAFRPGPEPTSNPGKFLTGAMKLNCVEGIPIHRKKGRWSGDSARLPSGRLCQR